jgi:DNA polymerase-3 subunit epsilon
MEELVILDFETTGLSPSYARIIEVAAIVVRDQEIIGEFSQLMHPGCTIPFFITEITGITNQMLKGQPTPEDTMPKLKKFIANRPIFAHNAPFDQKFLVSEMENVGKKIDNKFLCTLKLSRRLIPNSPDFKLTTLISHLKIKMPKEHKAHRALSDVMSTYHVWMHMKNFVSESINKMPDIELFQAIERQPKNKIPHFLAKHSLMNLKA